MTIVKTLQPAASAKANNNSPRNPHDRARIKKTNTKCRSQPTRPRPPTSNKHPTQLPPLSNQPITSHQRNHPGKPPTQPPNSQTANPPIAHEKPSHTIKLKVHQCRLKNPPICSCQYKNTTLKISHPNPKNSSAIHP